MSAIAICINPMSGRDVRRLAAKASHITPEVKRDAVARIAIGADAAGIEHIFLADEPFRIASRALTSLNLSAKVHILDIKPLRHNAHDTATALARFLDAGVRTIASLGGDGTNRAIIRAALAQGADDLYLIPLSAGTNNAFPGLAEPTIAGMVAALAAQGRLAEIKKRCKLLHVQLADGSTDVGLIDAAVLANDHTGNLLPFDSKKLRLLVLTRSDPAIIGMASIGGMLEVVLPEDDHGLLIKTQPGHGQSVMAAISPGLFERIGVSAYEKLPCDQAITLPESGVLALDGDRDYQLNHYAAPATLSIRRDGPWVLDTVVAMRTAVHRQWLPDTLLRSV